MVPFDSWIVSSSPCAMIGIIVQEKPYVKNIPGVQPLGNSALIFPHDFRHRGRFVVKI
jgi:hypothetical protein